jgi:hypothetical protein
MFNPPPTPSRHGSDFLKWEGGGEIVGKMRQKGIEMRGNNIAQAGTCSGIVIFSGGR